ncbi:helix-turn-helix domain-containing protein [Kordia zhangzhouensis]|uniref:helix-turn-helix domain-containing protein n=1 Tax=Kordia zhangzhouensis TaxID=1620405 RepID=UPI0006293019|nr:helix-turn-helix domain-containing protein [Kordia zhangzhouensis]
MAAQTKLSHDRNDTLQAFREALPSHSFYKLTRIFHAEKNKDSLKAALVASYLKEHYLNASNPKIAASTAITLPYWEDKVGNLEAAIALFDKGINLASTIKNDSILYLAHLRKGFFYFKSGKNFPALRSYYNALEIAKEANDLKRKVAVTGNIALVKMQANDTKAAIALLLENLEIINNNPSIINDKQKLNIYVNLCGAYTYIEEYELATLYCDKGVQLNETINNKRAEAHFLSAFAEIETAKGNYQKAHTLLDKTETLIDNMVGNESLNLFAKFYRGKTYYGEKKYQKAIEELQKIEELKETHKLDFLSLQEMYYYIAKSYTALGNAEMGVKYHEKAIEIDTENDKKMNELNANIVKKFDLVQLKEEINTLQEKSKQTKYIYTVGIVSLVLIIVGLLFFNKRQQKKNKERFKSLMLQLEEKRQQEKARKEVVLNEKNAHKEPEVLVKKETEEPEDIEEIDEITLEILNKLDAFETQEMFLSPESTLVEVAKKLQTNTTYLSKVINRHKQKSFTSYITDLRVEYAIEKLSTDRKFRSFTIGAIAQEIGFKRSESFSKAFKVKTGLYPSYFIKELEKQ